MKSRHVVRPAAEGSRDFIPAYMVGRKKKSGERAVSRILCPPQPRQAEADGGCGHLSGSHVAARLEQPTRGLSPFGERSGPLLAPYLALLPMGFAVPRLSPGGRCALTAPFHPCLIPPSPKRGRAIGGLLSVALSLALRPVAVSDHRALWSSDFPPGPEGPGGRITRSPDSGNHYTTEWGGRHGFCEAAAVSNCGLRTCPA